MTAHKAVTIAPASHYTHASNGAPVHVEPLIEFMRALFADDTGIGSAWMSQGLCAQIGPESFWPGKWENYSAARAICGMCDVRDTCGAYGVGNDEWGMWGGLSPRERTDVRTGRDDTSSDGTADPDQTERQVAA